MNKLYKICGIIMIVLGVFMALLFLIGIGFSSLVIGAICILIGVLMIKKAPAVKRSDDNVVVHTDDLEVKDRAAAGFADNLAVSSDKMYSFYVAGVTFRSKEIRDLAIENDEYEMSKRDMIECDMVDEPVYKYDKDFGPVTLEPEPDNEYDENAIKVMQDGVLIGYVPKEKTGRVKRIIGGPYEAEAQLFGGPCKTLREDYDDENDKIVYAIEKSDSDIGIKVTLLYGA